MRCPSCSQLLPPDAQFCIACGTALGIHTPRATSGRQPAVGRTIRLHGVPVQASALQLLVASAFTLAVVFGVALVMAHMPDLAAGAGALAALIFAALCAQWLWMDGRRAAGAIAMLLWVLAVGWALA